MVEADGHLKQLPTSIYMYKVFDHIDMPSTCIQYQSYTAIPTLLGADFGVRGRLWSRNDAFFAMVDADSNLKLLPTSILDTKK
jgi:hypothetical protein